MKPDVSRTRSINDKTSTLSWKHKRVQRKVPSNKARQSIVQSRLNVCRVLFVPSRRSSELRWLTTRTLLLLRVRLDARRDFHSDLCSFLPRQQRSAPPGSSLAPRHHFSSLQSCSRLPAGAIDALSEDCQRAARSAEHRSFTLCLLAEPLSHQQSSDGHTGQQSSITTIGTTCDTAFAFHSGWRVRVNLRSTCFCSQQRFTVSIAVQNLAISQSWKARCESSVHRSRCRPASSCHGERSCLKRCSRARHAFGSIRIARHIETPSKTEGAGNKDLLEARLPSPSKAGAVTEARASPERAPPLVHAFTSPVRQDRYQATQSLSTPPPAASAEAKPETPVLSSDKRATCSHSAARGRIWRQGVPEKPSYSPRRAYANSSARNNDYGMKSERVPARRVLVQPTPAARQASAKLTESQATGAARVASVASKAARTVSSGASRIGGHSSSLPATALTRFASSSHAPAPSASTAAAAAVQPAVRSVSSSQGSSVASKASRLQRSASVAFGTKPVSPSEQARSLSGLPRPRSMQAPSSSAPASGPGSRLLGRRRSDRLEV